MDGWILELTSPLTPFGRSSGKRGKRTRVYTSYVMGEDKTVGQNYWETCLGRSSWEEKCSWEEVLNKHVSNSPAQSVDKWTTPDTKWGNTVIIFDVIISIFDDNLIGIISILIIFNVFSSASWSSTSKLSSLLSSSPAAASSVDKWPFSDTKWGNTVRTVVNPSLHWHKTKTQFWKKLKDAVMHPLGLLDIWK